MTLTKGRLQEFARSAGLDLFGVANIERFQNAPARMSPQSIFPAARSVIVVGKRILRGGWRGVEEGTYWPGYTYFDYHGLLNSFFIPHGLYELACFMEDYGWEAVPYYPGVPESQPPPEPLRKGGVAADVHLAIRIAGVAAGIGEIGWSKVFLTRKYGPRQRLAAIITDMPLEPDPLPEPRSICDRCMQCVRGCPGAIPHMKEGRTVSIQIEDKVYEWADVDMGKCTLMYHGGDPRVSPFIHRDLPGYRFDVTEQEISEETAYKLAWPMSTGRWRKTEEHPSGFIIEGHALLSLWGIGEDEGSSYGIEGSRGCMRSCFDHMGRAGRVEQTYHSGPFIRRPRWMLPSKVEKSGQD